MQKSTIYGSKFSVTRTNQTLLIEGLARSAGSHDFLWGHQEALWTEAWLSNDWQVAWITVLMCLLSMQLENLLPSIFKPTSFLILLIRRIILFLGYTTKTWMNELGGTGHKASYRLNSSSSYLDWNWGKLLSETLFKGSQQCSEFSGASSTLTPDFSE